jgi:hypothetical protein
MKLIKILSFIIVTLVIANVTLTNKSVDEGVVLSQLNKDILKLQNDNAILRADIAQAGSITKLRAQIEEAGFVTSQKIVSLGVASSVASR